MAYPLDLVLNLLRRNDPHPKTSFPSDQYQIFGPVVAASNAASRSGGVAQPRLRHGLYGAAYDLSGLGPVIVFATTPGQSPKGQGEGGGGQGGRAGWEGRGWGGQGVGRAGAGGWEGQGGGGGGWGFETWR